MENFCCSVNFFHALWSLYTLCDMWLCNVLHLLLITFFHLQRKYAFVSAHFSLFWSVLFYIARRICPWHPIQFYPKLLIKLQITSAHLYTHTHKYAHTHRHYVSCKRRQTNKHTTKCNKMVKTNTNANKGFITQMWCVWCEVAHRKRSGRIKRDQAKKKKQKKMIRIKIAKVGK